MSDIETIAQACAKLDVDIPSYQYGNYSEGGVSGMIYHADILKLYLAAESEFDELAEEIYSGTRSYPKGVDDKVWMVVDMHWEEILKCMHDNEDVIVCEECDVYLWPNDHCGTCGNKVATEQSEDE